jgi:hypothetical protein
VAARKPHPHSLCHARHHRPVGANSKRRCSLAIVRGESVLALLVGVVLLLLLPHPWNGVGFAAAMTWEIVTILYCLRWSQRQAP